ncbi:MAG: MFS transporter [Geodermatophilaceae bacterium]|nr:MFS transporter [Geodermatophilaceae bacterium]
MRQYLTVWKMPSAPTLLLAGFAGRLPASMVPLALLLLVEQHTGSYAIAGLAAATYGLSIAAFAPIYGRFADRRGASTLLLVTAAVFPFLLAGLVATVVLGAPLWTLLVACVVAGAGMPLVSSTVRAVWQRVTEGSSVRQAAYALDAISVELVFVAGPAVVAVLVLLTSPIVAIGLAAAMSMTGAIVLSRAPEIRGYSPIERVRGRRGPVRAPGMPRLLLSGSALMFGLGCLEVGVPAFADRLGSPGMAGVLIAVWALGSAIGGFWFGARHPQLALSKQYRWALLAVVVGMVPLVLADNLLVLGAMLFLGGTTLAPTLTVQNSLVSVLVPAGVATEAFTWMTTVAYGASAIGAGVAGVLVEGAFGVAGALALAALASVAALAISLVPGRSRPSGRSLRPVYPHAPVAQGLAA